MNQWKSAECGELFAALAKARAEFAEIPRNLKVNVRTKSGGTYEFKYADLGTVHKSTVPSLSKHQLAVTQNTTDGYLHTVLGHASGQWISSRVAIGEPGEPQAYGSLLTYLRRYEYCAIVGVQAESDDDGNFVSGNQARVSTNQNRREKTTAAAGKTDAKSDPVDALKGDVRALLARRGEKSTERAADAVATEICNRIGMPTVPFAKLTADPEQVAEAAKIVQCMLLEDGPELFPDKKG